MVGFPGNPVGTEIGYVFWAIQKIDKSSFNPLEDLITGIPLNQIIRIIEFDMPETLGEDLIPKPAESVNGTYVM